MTVTYSKRKKEESFLAIKPNKSRVVVFDSQEESSKPVAKAMHELQEAGETSRFIDEMEYLLEGLNAQSALAIRRASAKELAMKCTNAAFATKIRALGYTIKIISCFLEDVDELHSDLIVSLGFLLSLLFQQNRKLELGNLSEKYFNFLVSLIFSQNAIDANCVIFFFNFN